MRKNSPGDAAAVAFGSWSPIAEAEEYGAFLAEYAVEWAARADAEGLSYPQGADRRRSGSTASVDGAHRGDPLSMDCRCTRDATFALASSLRTQMTKDVFSRKEAELAD